MLLIFPVVACRNASACNAIKTKTAIEEYIEDRYQSIAQVLALCSILIRIKKLTYDIQSSYEFSIRVTETLISSSGLL